MTRFRAYIDAPRPADHAFATAAALAESLSPERPATLYAAPLAGNAVVLGAHQQQAHALSARGLVAAGHPPVLRRASGGIAVCGGDGVLYVALALAEPSALMACPPGKILNRYARGVLTGLRALGVQGNYFGRDFVSAGAEPVAYIGWAQRASGSVLVESFVALDRVFSIAPELVGYPEPSEPAFRGRPLTTVRASTTHAPLEAHAVLDAIANGHARAFNAHREDEALSDAERARSLIVAGELAAYGAARHAQDAELVWSAPQHEVIGFVSAGVALGGDGTVRAVRVGGDFFQHDSCGAALHAALRGRKPTQDALATAVDQAFAARPFAIEGVRSLRSLHAALLDAVTRAQSTSHHMPS